MRRSARAVIGGLLGATVTTLFVVPIIYTYLRTKPPVDQERRLEEEERGCRSRGGDCNLVEMSQMKYEGSDRSETEEQEPRSCRPNRWHPSGITISALLLGLAVLLVAGFFAGYLPLQRREATVRAEADEQEKSTAAHGGDARGPRAECRTS